MICIKGQRYKIVIGKGGGQEVMIAKRI